jgi:hypothetical protein
MAGDALDRLKNRSRSTVPLRDAHLIEPNPEAAVKASKPTQPETQQPSGAQSPSASGLNLAPFNPLEPVEEGLMRLCSDTEITKEAFIAAAYLACTHHPQFRQEVLRIAHQRCQAQQHEATLRQQRKVQNSSTSLDDTLWLL